MISADDRSRPMVARRTRSPRSSRRWRRRARTLRALDQEPDARGAPALSADARAGGQANRDVHAFAQRILDASREKTDKASETTVIKAMIDSKQYRDDADLVADLVTLFGGPQSAGIPAALMPFSIGKRDCLGQLLAQIGWNTIVPRLIIDHDFEIAQEGIEQFGFFLEPAGLTFSVQEAT